MIRDKTPPDPLTILPRQQTLQDIVEEINKTLEILEQNNNYPDW